MTRLRGRVPLGQRGMALLVSLVFLLLLTLIGLSSLQNATLQEKMAASLALHNRAFQAAEAALRVGESAVQQDDFACRYVPALLSVRLPPNQRWSRLLESMLLRRCCGSLAALASTGCRTSVFHRMR